MPNLRWTDDGKRSTEVRERDFTIDRQGKAIPGVVWQPLRATGAQPLVLMGHGGTGHKRSAKMLRMAEIFTASYGWWAAAIDGPVHGARGSGTDAPDPAIYRQMWTRPTVVQDMIDDWTAVLDALTLLDEIDKTRIGYWGVSMGTMFGLPYVASDARIRAAVLGKAGMRGNSVQRSGIDQHFKVYAARVTVPVLFTIQWDDERFDRDGQIELYESLGSTDKRLHAYPGRHADDGPEALEASAAFLHRYLK
jgi:dienelactone hydrolase